MAKVFTCPHCDKKYPVLPTLVGRKVRCTSCKNIFQLQYDGIAIKVEVAGAPSSSALAPKAKDPGQELQADVPAPSKPLDESSGEYSAHNSNVEASGRQSISKAPVRRQTKALKRKTERIRKIRSSLQSAAEQAISSVADEPGQEKPKSDRQKNESMQVVLTGSGNDRTAQRFLVKLLIAIGIAIAAVLYLLPEASVMERALNVYGSTVPVEQNDYPMRMDVYRSRMWIYTRDGVNVPPVILDAESAQLHQVADIDWSRIKSHCSALFEGMSFVRDMGLWVQTGKLDDVRKQWNTYPLEKSWSSFFKSLNQQNIPLIHCKDVPRLLVEKGMTKEEVYVASLFLVGTQDKLGTALNFFDASAPNVLELYEFRADKGYVLVDGHGEYTYSNSDNYSGLLLGISGSTDVERDWRVLDIRFSKQMDEFYSLKHSPLLIAAEIAHAQMAEAFGKRKAAVRNQ